MPARPAARPPCRRARRRRRTPGAAPTPARTSPPAARRRPARGAPGASSAPCRRPATRRRSTRPTCRRSNRSRARRSRRPRPGRRARELIHASPSVPPPPSTSASGVCIVIQRSSPAPFRRAAVAWRPGCVTPSFPLRVGAGVIAGIAGKSLFRALWGLIDDHEAPKPEHRRIRVPMLALALVVEGCSGERACRPRIASRVRTRHRFLARAHRRPSDVHSPRSSQEFCVARPRATHRAAKPLINEGEPMAELTAADGKLVQYLNEAYGLEQRLETSLQAHIAMTSDTAYRKTPERASERDQTPRARGQENASGSWAAKPRRSTRRAPPR